jgi:hypothetical protein
VQEAPAPLRNEYIIAHGWAPIRSSCMLLESHAPRVAHKRPKAHEEDGENKGSPRPKAPRRDRAGP